MASPRDELDEELRRNASTCDSFGDFASHRARVMQLLRAAATPSGSTRRLVLLGAGNCNDVDLNQLVAHYDRIDLVDWDAAALAWGREQQGFATDSRLVSHAPIDLRASDWQLPEADVVASLCVLSQLIDALRRTTAGGPAELAGEIGNLVQNHLRQLVELLQPGGVGLLVTDFASSQTVPELATAGEAELPAVAGRLLQSGNFFQGLHPGGLYQRLTTQPWFASRIRCQIPLSPWNWKVGNRVYAVSALVMRRKIVATSPIEG